MDIDINHEYIGIMDIFMDKIGTNNHWFWIPTMQHDMLQPHVVTSLKRIHYSSRLNWSEGKMMKHLLFFVRFFPEKMCVVSPWLGANCHFPSENNPMRQESRIV